MDVVSPFVIQVEPGFPTVATMFRNHDHRNQAIDREGKSAGVTLEGEDWRRRRVIVTEDPRLLRFFSKEPEY